MATETVSFRLSKELKDLAKKYGLNVSKIAKEKVEEELEKLQKEERKKMLEKAADVLEDVTKQDIVTAVRKSREAR
ncbi:type II toxin-antitoxin system CcdA family antitoxin [Candidatus Nitrososphaera evergladensis]|uniref:type II toxin-antitoxin system CcdA family antitoxin n=1 Tax=Candidatus Nitrososphaera evergladensis TaxID=1459637 RepID=UPI00130ECDE9|nr:type II toxin-antitoxin system CcdA family antitoxin [Candidatus Nitrososphaera evergladensis]